MEPFLRWAGSKRKLLTVLKETIPTNFDRYVEPFAGSACLFFALQPSTAVLADINAELINAYREVKEGVNQVLEELSRFKGEEEEYYKVRSTDGSRLSSAERAAHFIYLNRFCFNGLYRTNKIGQFNVPYGGYKSGSLPSTELLCGCAKVLQRASLRACSFDQTLEEAKSGDFVYLDPPYCIRSRRVFNEYSNFAFGNDQLSTLRRQLIGLDHLGIPFLVSYGISREGFELGRGFRTRRRIVQRQIAGFASKRRKSWELLITNY